MAAITGTYGMVRRSHLCARFTLGSISDSVSNADLFTTSGFAALSGISATNSPLYSFLSTVYADAATAELAFRAIGGQVVMRQVSGTATTVISWAWTASAAVPTVVIAGGADQVLEIAISVPNSQIQ